MKKLLIVICIAICLCFCSCNVQSGSDNEYGSFVTDEVLNSFDNAYYSVQTIEDDSVLIRIYTSDDELEYEVNPCRSMDYWGMVWENDRYAFWIQSGDVGTLCYELVDGVWEIRTNRARPEYIISRYDSMTSETLCSDTILPTESSISNQDVSTNDQFEYSVSPMDINLTFDDIIDRLNSHLDINESDYYDESGIINNFNSGSNRIYYEPDYESFIYNESQPDPFTGAVYIVPSDYDYHIMRVLGINHVMYVYEFDSNSWAEEYYRKMVHYTLWAEDELASSSYSDGYCLRVGQYYRSGTMFMARYFLGNIVVDCSWSFERDNVEDYELYLELCDVLGLPTSDEATQVILR